MSDLIKLSVPRHVRFSDLASNTNQPNMYCFTEVVRKPTHSCKPVNKGVGLVPLKWIKASNTNALQGLSASENIFLMWSFRK